MPPAGQGNSFTFTVSAPNPVSVQVPGWKANGTGGYMEVSASAPGQRGSFALWAAPQGGEIGCMNWLATSTTPPLFGKGTLEIVQVVTPNQSYNTFQLPGVKHNDPENGLNGLDTVYPYPAPTYNEGPIPYGASDNPSLGLNSNIGSATMQHSFTDYLMYQPPGSSQWVPLSTFTWSTNGNADVPFTDNWADYGVINGSSVAGSVTPASQSFTAGNTFPSWKRINVFPNLSLWN